MLCGPLWVLLQSCSIMVDALLKVTMQHGDNHQDSWNSWRKSQQLEIIIKAVAKENEFGQVTVKNQSLCLQSILQVMHSFNVGSFG